VAGGGGGAVVVWEGQLAADDVLEGKARGHADAREIGWLLVNHRWFNFFGCFIRQVTVLVVVFPSTAN
jgi:hypothetical protein